MEYNPFSLKDKNILVTGASSGIGRAIAVECSRLGANVTITARNVYKLQETLSLIQGDSHRVISADISTSEGIDSVVGEVPVLSGVVHCAGIGDRTLGKMIREKDISRVMNINFNASVLLQRLLLKKKKIENKASVVFIASRAPFAPTIGNSLYSASKAALIAYAKVLSLELASLGIRVNCVCPAMVWTELVEKDADMTGVDYRELEKSYPLKRYGKPEDIAYLVDYLLADCSEWMTGSCIDITGGAVNL